MDTKISRTGQVTIPKAVREKLGIKPGDRVVLTVAPDGAIILRVKTGSILDLGGVLYERGRETVPIEKLSF
ncbi:hypothetical protein GCM10027321_08910 [Massilia terrae]|uniref:AbrB/MazE/SpoVT family DNA-binding domain-containing protein n=1 Tax=Massilia terrae TaxID=1811224 RepID=A0ABT2CZY3_9BURK|nr:AbrB/MazE/SpoVT family DNA-binding domain-containing protein [Massilia terrae]MCS0659536.1 AbrB/MazE/SpoVT family DNA-binding domain-containing protein [Massilia terrae]